MKYLLPGSESKERVKLLLKLTKMNSEAVRSAVLDHLCKGHSERNTAELNGVPLQNFNRAMLRLNELAGVVEEIKALDWERFKSNQLSDDN